MRILVIGGTRFVGKAIVHEAARRGHQVEVFHRGSTPLGGLGVGEIIGDRDLDTSGLATGSWDATVDVCAYRPHQVEELAAVLGERGGHHTFVSTVSYYADSIPDHSDESAAAKETSVLAGMDPRTCPIDGETYGALKVLCEEAVRAHHSSLLMIRPTYVIGPDDYTMRYPKWVERIAAGGVIPAPNVEGVPLQYIDARDQAAFVVDQIERQATDTFHCVGPRADFTFNEMLEQTASAIAPTGTRFSFLSYEESLARSEEFPLWNGRENPGPMRMNPDAALQAGMKIRSLSQTASDTLHWLNTKV